MWFRDGEIVLRALEPEDLEWLYALENDERLWEWGYSNVPYSRFSLKTYIAESRHDLYADGQLRLAITLGPEGTVCGCVDLADFSPRHLRAEVGIVLFPEFQGRGYATRVLRMLAAYAKDFLSLHQLYAVVSEKNCRAQHLFCRAGYCRAAELPDWLSEGSGCYVSASLFTLRL